MLIWIDLETTGLDPQREQILEIAAVADIRDSIESMRYYRENFLRGA